MWRHLYLLRHGETEWNTQRRFRGRADIGLSDRGRRQAQIAADHLTDRGIDLILCSPLARSRQTASLLAERLDLDPVECPELIDPDTGNWTGMEVSGVRLRYPDLFQRMSETPSRFRFPGGESVKEVEARVKTFLHEKLDEMDRVEILAVTHNFICQVATLCVLGCNMDNIYRLEQDHCAITSLENKGNRIDLVKFNENHFLRGV